MFRSLSRVATNNPFLSAGRVPAGTKSLLSHQSTLATGASTCTLTGIVRRRQPTITIASLPSVQLSTTATTSSLVASYPSALLSGDANANANPTTGRNFAWWFFAAGATVATVASAMGRNDSVTLCDKTNNFHADTNNNDNNDDEDEVDEDPYDNLPEQDEPTHCSICLTYRQGPCRPYWRKVEACTKDHELKKKPDEDDDSNKNNDSNSDNTKDNPKSSSNDNNHEEEEPLEDPPCLKYMLPWIDCATGYRNLYALIELDTNYTMGIAELENEATVQACWAPSYEPTIDWTPWQEYVATHPRWKLPKRSTTTSNKNSLEANHQHVSLWKTLGTDRDPEMVDVLASVPSQQGQGILECAYALDQDGHVLGFSYGTKPSEVASKFSSDHDDEEGDKSTSNPVELKIRLLPLHTRAITVAAAYTQPAKEGAKENDTLESHIFKSRPFSLKKLSTTTVSSTGTKQ